ncbi:sigma-70 family RNA polymerase sigma factor [Antrihabitans cavernicola]|uniref:RNA polymerase sigma factor n=1 Tax=Antrihabitans cavernicola TaxID=2495913 RepID=A0A5A7S5M7_9NOCA|nr:sigma-70 family RNA polymerase sigma factor [Spelaeibacter cavernicola]KAA0017026.1 sigma-70 family RNA polymerase sigma factor [Spelaeibacter cavernicola]
MSMSMQSFRVLDGEQRVALRDYARSLTSDRARVEDIVQETLLRAWQHPEVLDRSRGEPRPWLWTVARHLAIDYSRSACVRHEVCVAALPPQPADDRFDQVLDRWIIFDALAALSKNQREVVVLTYFRGMTPTEVAGEVDVAVGTIKSRLHYALAHMRCTLLHKGVKVDYLGARPVR